MGYRVAVIGATGNAGREILSALAERNFPADEVVALASDASVGKEVSYGEDDILKVRDLGAFDFKGFDIALAAPGGRGTATHAMRAAAAGCVVVDGTAQFRLDPDVPLVVPEVNPQALAGYRRKGIVASPGGATIQMALTLKPLHDRFRVRRVVVATYQAVSEAGKEGMDELFNQTRAIYVNDPVEKSAFAKQIAFNVIPQIDAVMEDGYTREEWSMNAETKKILDPRIRVTATCVRVPVFIGHSAAVTIECEEPVTAGEAREALRAAPGVEVVDQRSPDGFVTPVEVAGEDAVFVSRIREDISTDNGLSFWCASDNLRKGAALNAVQIAERLAHDHLEG